MKKKIVLFLKECCDVLFLNEWCVAAFFSLQAKFIYKLPRLKIERFIKQIIKCNDFKF